MNGQLQMVQILQYMTKANGQTLMVTGTVIICKAMTQTLVLWNGAIPQVHTFHNSLSDGSLELNFVVTEKFGCIDTDGDGFYDFADDLPEDSRDYIDSDGDLVGASQDYNDSNRLVQTVFDHCELIVTDVTETCQGVRDADYQNYVDDKESNGEIAKITLHG